MAPDRSPLAGLVEIDETAIPHRTTAGSVVAHFDGAGATAKTDSWPAYEGAPGAAHGPHVSGPMAVHVVLPWTHLMFSNLKR